MITSTVANKYAVVRSFGSSSIIGCSEKASIITKIFESYSELVPSSLEIKVLKKKFLSIHKKSRQTYCGRCGNYNMSYSKKSLLRFYKILFMILIQVMAFWMKERTNKCNYDVHLLQSNISTNFHNYWIYFNRAGVSQDLGTSIFLYHFWTWIFIGVKVEWNSKIHPVFKSVCVI